MAVKRSAAEPFGYSLNTSTIKGTLVEKIEIAGKAGYDGIEPWVRDIDAFVAEGASLADLRKRFQDNGLAVLNLIAFFEWVVDDDARRAKGLEEARRVMDMARQLNCSRLAAPPMGMQDTPGLDLLRAAERYRTLLEAGDEYGVVPVLEFWSHSQSLGYLGEAALVMAMSGHRDACMLLDVFHMYRKGSPFEGIRMLSGSAIGLVHINDYPAEPPRSAISDKDRVFPGDGVAPLGAIIRDILATGYRGMLSLELFNESYWARDPFEIAKEGLEKTKRSVNSALSSS